MTPINFPIIVKTTHKASSIVLLYNVVESTITKCLISIHEAICSEQLGYFALSDKIQKISLTYHNSVLNKSNNFHDAAEYVHSFIENLFDHSKFGITFEDLGKYYSLYSGNLDSREIGRVLLKYGINIEGKISELQTVKNGRNLLAHGEKSFEEYGRELSVQQLEIIVAASFSYLESVINKVDEFIKQKEFRVTN